MTAVVSVLVAVIVATAVAAVARARVRERGEVDELPRDTPMTAVDVTARTRILLAKGRKLDAIRVYRDFHRLELKDATDAVEAIERQGLPPAQG